MASPNAISPSFCSLSSQRSRARAVASGVEQEIASAIAYLVSPTARSTVGVVLPVDGGMAGLRLRPPGK